MTSHAAGNAVVTRIGGREAIRPALDAFVELPGGAYRLGEREEQRAATLGPVLIGRWPVVNAHARRFFDATGRRPGPGLAARLEAAALADHPVTDFSFDGATAFCRWATAELGRPVRLPTG